MMKRVKALMNNQKGLTLVELLAVIVILGIIAAIAVPSIGNIIDNSKKDAHIANAQQLISSAKLAVAANDDIVKNRPVTVTYEQLEKAGYLADLTDPDDKGKLYSTAQVKITETNGKYEYTVTLIGSKRSITNKKASELNRESVVAPTPSTTT
ncbi:type II secretion system protein [Peribacillus huizhouensis]|uniref:Type IV pilus assembly protein PilA n=1 Tax=Peribacillus huizhouensis TaxID=1501239 RepID=A0ABR6CM59_9BACI|nr:type II secretion system protein [Peribacillus huizhouensis]MBA9025738.1 type IV pilus assembly protein PilA [Peribacillus huizhouensis]